MKKIILFLLLLASATSMTYGQDTIKVMFYNILNFPNPTNTNPAGNDATRSAHFSDIVEEADADIVVIQELKSETGADMLLTAMNNNSNGKTFGRAPNYVGYGTSGNQLGNMLFYNTAEVQFLQQIEIPLGNTAMGSSGNTLTAPRKKSYYEVEVFSPSNPADKDTLHVIGCHFKGGSNDHAGSTTLIPDNERRILDALDVIDFLNNNSSEPTSFEPTDNILVGGDFNFYSHLADNPSASQYDEPAYDSLIVNTNYSVQLIDVLGGWTRDDPTPSNVEKYTQSTRNPSNLFGNDGPGGSLDDRFDFIVFNNTINNGDKKLSYVTDSYETFGSVNQLNAEASASASPVATQLYQMSDHYPVVAHFKFTGSSACAFSSFQVTNETCVGTDFEFEVQFSVANGSGTYELVDITNGNTILDSGTGNTLTGTLVNQANTTPFEVVVRDANTMGCQSSPITITPIACASSCFIGNITTTTTCQSNNTYDLEVCFDYTNNLSNDVMLNIDGTTYGPYAYPGVSGGCVLVSAATLNALGDGTTGIPIEVYDAGSMFGGTPFISEIHYDNVGNDEGEFVEISALSTTDLSDYKLEFFNGNPDPSNATLYSTVPLFGIINNEGNGCGSIAFPVSGIENGADDGVALVRISDGMVIEFLSWEGTIIAGGGDAAGMTSTDIGVSESSGTPVGESLQLTDAGWTGPLAESPGTMNSGLTSCGTSLACSNISSYDEPQCVPSGCTFVINQVTPICLGNNLYDLELCFEYYNPLSTQVRIHIEGTDYGTYDYPTTSGDCITIPATTLNLTGDGTANLNLLLEDAASSTMSVPPFISEIHYDNGGTDVGEFIEISGPAGTDLSNYTLYAYEGADGAFDDLQTLSGVLLNDGSGCGSLFFTPAEIGSQYFENGTEDGYALVDAANTVIEFISYEGTITATNGPAAGMTSTDIGVSQSSSTAIGASLQKTDAGWITATDDSPGVYNANLSCSAGMLCEATTTYDEPTCDAGCPDILGVDSGNIASGTYSASVTIHSAGTVGAMQNVVFDAGNDINLLEGFCVPLGSEFMAVIGGCSVIEGEANE